MRRWPRRFVLLAVILTASGCSELTVFQQPLASDQPARPQPTDPTLVLGGADQPDDWTAHRNDSVTGNQRRMYYGPSGKMYFEDGSAVPFDSVRKQLQDLRAEERIR
ncbi:MAG: hypothetical protein ACYSU7_05125 [Planctomycetota bacterium]|jgi:hypothetical protein